MLIGKEIDEALNNVFDYLNTIDLMPYIIKFKNKDIKELMDWLDENFPYKDKYSVDLFDTVSSDEFVDYLNKRYNLKIKETTISFYYITI